MFLIPEKTYQFNKENINYLFNMDAKDRTIYNINRLIDKESKNIDFTDLNDLRIIISFGVFITLVTSYCPVFAVGTGLQWADGIGNTFLHYSQAVGMWVCVIKAILTLIQAVVQDTVSACWKNIIGYAIAGLAIYKIPNIFFTLK
ncbi:hypothetical protein Ccar_16405 [Clostridium carboxidivorans P7]|uniref:hypothetical protein n=1 Tax=Clostridium carboxidivorans TaxID=217159 RepID=UPI00064F5F84|nr:hypothetical protein [Clostridium carboxidivorans]AKN32358.1 hypothetical protein Ccar_16405 [Clostridium carboxidivorans P7]